MHTCLQVGSSKLFLYTENSENRRGGSSFYNYVEDADAGHQQTLDVSEAEMIAAVAQMS